MSKRIPFNEYQAYLYDASASAIDNYRHVLASGFCIAGPTCSGLDTTTQYGTNAVLEFQSTEDCYLSQTKTHGGHKTYNEGLAAPVSFITYSGSGTLPVQSGIAFSGLLVPAYTPVLVAMQPERNYLNIAPRNILSNTYKTECRIIHKGNRV
jgi:hypothetical protein